MMFDLSGNLGSLPLAKHVKSRAINAENPTGEKGKGHYVGTYMALTTLILVSIGAASGL